MMDADFVRKYCEEQSKPFDDACEEMIERRNQMDSAQLQTAEDLKKLREQFEESQLELKRYQNKQDKDARIDRIYDLVAIIVAIASMIISLVK